MKMQKKRNTEIEKLKNTDIVKSKNREIEKLKKEKQKYKENIVLKTRHF